MDNFELKDHNQLPPPLYLSRKATIFTQWKYIFRNLRAYSFFIRQLIRIDFLSEFKRSFIGFLWLFILPILSIITWVLLNSVGVIDPGDTSIPYPAYVLLSTSIWQFFIKIYARTSRVLNQRGGMMIMCQFPHEVLIAERFIVHFIRFAIPFATSLIVLLLFGVRFTWLALLFPLTLLPLLFLGAGIGLFVALLRVVAVDLAKIIDKGLNFLMFLTPIVYAPKIEIEWLSFIIRINPLSYLIGFSRELLINGTFYAPLIWGFCSFICFFLFLFSVRFFLIVEPKMLERLINN